MRSPQTARRFLALGIVLLAAIPLAAQDRIQGSWAALVKEEVLHFKMTIFMDEDGDLGEWDTSVALRQADLKGLQLADKEHEFQLERDAGKILFQGRFSGKRGQGDFEFVPAPDFASFLGREGFDEITDRKLLSLCLCDAGRNYIRDMKQTGLDDLTLSRIVSFAVHRIDRTYVRDIIEAGFPGISSSHVISFKVHDIDKAYIRDMKKAFPDLSSSHLISFAVHEITPVYVRDIVEAGFHGISSSHVISFKVHDIDGAYVRRLQKLMDGKTLAPEKVIQLKLAGI